MSFISESSNSVRSVVKPALHVGEQISGGVGCLAAVGRGGTATTSGSGFRKGCAQPLSSSTSAVSISTGFFGTDVGFIGDFLHLLGAAVFNQTGGFNGRGMLLGSDAPLIGDVRFQRDETVRLQRAEGRERHGRDQKDARDHWVMASTMALATSHLRS